MAVQELFDKGRREDIRKALSSGNAEGLFRRRKPAHEAIGGGGYLESGWTEQLLPGRMVQMAGFNFRFMGVEGNSAIVTWETPKTEEKKIFVIIGETKEFSYHSEGEGAPAFFHICLTARESRDISGMGFVTVDAEVKGVKSS